MELIASRITKSYTRGTDKSCVFSAVQPTDLVLQPGKLIEISGKSGSGKTTLLSILAGLLKPSEGEVNLDGKNIYSLDDDNLSKLRNDYFGVIPQAPSILSSLSVAENVLLPLTLYKKKNENHYARRLLEMLDIFDLAYEMPTQLSGGQIKRVAIARALVTKPKFIFADEPTGDLDDENTRIVLDCLRQIADEGASVLLVTHDIAAEHHEDEMYTMKNGVLTKTK